MRTRAATTGMVVAVAAIGKVAEVAVAQAVLAAEVAVAQAVLAAEVAVAQAVVLAAVVAVVPEARAAGADVPVVSMPSAATPSCPGARWPREAKAGC
jgi:hypothetical protein